jgi:hypothetical protein
MSIEEQIAVLESEKQSYLHRVEERLTALRAQSVTPSCADEDAPAIRPDSRFHPIPSIGVPASEMIIRDRN